MRRRERRGVAGRREARPRSRTRYAVPLTVVALLALLSGVLLVAQSDDGGAGARSDTVTSASSASDRRVVWTTALGRGIRSARVLKAPGKSDLVTRS